VACEAPWYESIGWINYPRAPKMQRLIVEDWRMEAMKQCGRVYDKWNLGGQTVKVSGPLFSDDADVVRRWSLEGEGIAYKSWLDVSADIAAKRLLVLLPDHTGEASPLSLVCPHRKQTSPAVSQLYTWLSGRFSALERS
jgi:DNA-binding transcriptional LysR family regulator